MFTAPPNIALAWASNSSPLVRLSDAQQNPVRTNLSRPVALANGTQNQRRMRERPVRTRCRLCVGRTRMQGMGEER